MPDCNVQVTKSYKYVQTYQRMWEKCQKAEALEADRGRTWILQEEWDRTWCDRPYCSCSKPATRFSSHAHQYTKHRLSPIAIIAFEQLITMHT